MTTIVSRFFRHLASGCAAVAIALGIALAATSPSFAADKVVLKDGRVFEGTIVREKDGYIWIKATNIGVSGEQLVTPAEIKEIIRAEAKGEANPKPDAEAKKDEQPAADAKAEDKSAKKSRSGAPRAAVITLGGGGEQDMVGVYMTAENLRRMIPILKEENVEIVVFRINSGGGYGFEVERLGKVIVEEYRKEFTILAWVESAISAAAMTAHHIEDIYFMSKGNYGACTGWSGALVAVKGLQLERFLAKMERVSAIGGHDKAIMRSMQIEEPLYASIDEATGRVTWSNVDQLDHVVNPAGRILTFNAETAARFKFSKGTADDIETLGKLMGYSEVVWVGEKVEGVPYPVSKAEAFNRQFRNRVAEDERRTREYISIFNQSVAMAQGAQGDQRGAFIGKARNQFESIKRMVNNNPNFALTLFNLETPEEWKDFVRREEEMLRRLAVPR